MSILKTKTVLITGASRGIGLEIAQNLSNQGYQLVLIASSEASMDSLHQSSWVEKKTTQICQLDLSDKCAVSTFLESWASSLWGIVNNAGICKTHTISDVGIDPFEEVLATNLLGPYQLTKGLLPYISRPGRIVNISSQLGQEGRAGYAAYCASKFGVIGMTKCWAKELGSEGVTVNAVCPGWVDTEMSKIDMQRMAIEKNTSLDNYYKQICEPLELKRFNSTSEVANLVAFLLSEGASGITGRDWLMQTVWNQL